MKPKSFVPTENVLTWETISERLSNFTPPIVITDYVDSEVGKPKVFDYTSQGINFVVSKQNRDGFLQALRTACTATGKQAFAEGRWQGAQHTAKGALRDLVGGRTANASSNSWALNVSFMATKGIGFREIWYLELSERQLRLENPRAFHIEAPKLDPRFSAMFDAPNSSIDLSSLHWSVGDPDEKTGNSQCNIHIDQVGFVADLGSGAALTPDFLYHTLLELAFRTGLKGYVPDPILQSVDFIMPSSHENYAFNFGAQVNVINRNDLRLSIRGMCGVRGDGCEWSGTINLSGTHDLLK